MTMKRNVFPFFVLRLAIAIAALVTLPACSPPKRVGMVVNQHGTSSDRTWTLEERSRDIVVRPLRATPEASYSIVMLSGAEPPHIHEKSDLTVFVIAGSARMTIGNQQVFLNVGDVVEIPRGVTHWAKNAGDGPCEVYVVAVPPMDPNDRKLVN